MSAPDRFDDTLRRALIIAAEVGLVLAIIALLLATWMPSLIGAHPWSVH